MDDGYPDPDRAPAFPWKVALWFMIFALACAALGRYLH